MVLLAISLMNEDGRVQSTRSAGIVIDNSSSRSRPKSRMSPPSFENLAKAWCVGLLLAPECCRKGTDLRRSSSFRPPLAQLVPSPTCGLPSDSQEVNHVQPTK
jgi:hypothetical protein